MSTATITLQLPEPLYTRLQGIAKATKRSLEEVMLRALSLGSPPGWDDVPPEFQVELARLDKMDDETLWELARSRKTRAEMARHDALLTRNAEGSLTEPERAELESLRDEHDLFVLRKAHAAALLRWRGHHVPALAG